MKTKDEHLRQAFQKDYNPHRECLSWLISLQKLNPNRKDLSDLLLEYSEDNKTINMAFDKIKNLVNKISTLKNITFPEDYTHVKMTTGSIKLKFLTVEQDFKRAYDPTNKKIFDIQMVLLNYRTHLKASEDSVIKGQKNTAIDRYLLALDFNLDNDSTPDNKILTFKRIYENDKKNGHIFEQSRDSAGMKALKCIASILVIPFIPTLFGNYGLWKVTGKDVDKDLQNIVERDYGPKPK